MKPRRFCCLGALRSLLLALLLVLPAAPALAVIDAELRVGREPGRTRLVVDLSAPAAYHVFSLRDPERVVIDLWDTRLAGPVPPDLFAATPVARLRTGLREETGLRLVLDLARQDLRRETFVLDPNGSGGGYRLVVDLYHGDAEPDPVTAAPAAPAAEPATGRVGSREPVRSVSRPARPAPAPGPAALPEGEPVPAVSDLHLGGYGELAAAWNTADPEHWSKLRARLELGLTGRLDWGARFKLAGRMEGDGAYSVEDDFYPSAVRRDQRSDFTVREAYLDFGAGAWEYRLGRQHVVWGEMVGLFLADVVSARDTREFFLEEFETMRIPQWAVRAERFAGDAHLELLWVPHPSYDEIGQPGADFYPFPVPVGTPVREITPSRSKLSNHGLGGRFSYLVDGWDLSGFYYQSTDVAPTLYRTDAGLELRHDRIRQAGATFSKDWLDFVLKGEAVYTSGRRFLSLDPAASFGLQDSDAVDYVLGVMVPRGDWRFDAQLYGRHVFDHDRDMGFDADETGLTLLLNRRFGDRFEAEVLYLTGLNRSDWSLQSSVTWNLTQDWRLQFGADLFGGSEIGLFGQYDDSDRVFLELRRWF
ncbi:MAG: AMIN domain-containing protein [Haliea sp.]|uniref:AMIN domain-containing protein n=1 Tax=Haliea sp. TaxID=1932666 RepID=UPI0032EC8431